MKEFFLKLLIKIPWVRDDYQNTFNEALKTGFQEGVEAGNLEASRHLKNALKEAKKAKKEQEDLRKYLDESLVLYSDNKFQCTFICNRKTGSVHCFWKFNGQIGNHYFDIPPAGSMYAAQAYSPEEYRWQIAKNMGTLIGQSIGKNIMADVEQAMRAAIFGDWEKPCEISGMGAKLLANNT